MLAWRVVNLAACAGPLGEQREAIASPILSDDKSIRQPVAAAQRTKWNGDVRVCRMLCSWWCGAHV